MCACACVCLCLRVRTGSTFLNTKGWGPLIWLCGCDGTQQATLVSLTHTHTHTQCVTLNHMRWTNIKGAPAAGASVKRVTREQSYQRWEKLHLYTTNFVPTTKTCLFVCKHNKSTLVKVKETLKHITPGASGHSSRLLNDSVVSEQRQKFSDVSGAARWFRRKQVT